MSDSSDAVNRILSFSGRRGEDPARYQAFIDSGGRPQGGFSVTLVSGDIHGFFYHALDDLTFVQQGETDLLSFTHRRRAVVIEGSGLRALMKALCRQTLMEIHEQDGRPTEPGQPVVTKIAVTDSHAG
jgi:hypothetical protein